MDGYLTNYADMQAEIDIYCLKYKAFTILHSTFTIQSVPAKKNIQKKLNKPLVGKTLIKEVNRRIRLARSHWDAHHNKACRRERQHAIDLYETLTKEQREQVPQTLRVWLRYRSEKYFGEHRTPPAS